MTLTPTSPSPRLSFDKLLNDGNEADAVLRVLRLLYIELYPERRASAALEVNAIAEKYR